MNRSQFNIIAFSIINSLLGKKITNSLYSKRAIRTYKKNDVIFIHIPKAAGTSICCELYGRRNGHLKAAYIKDKIGKAFDEKYSFSVCRNPYERLYSSYKFATQGHTKDGAIANASLYKNEKFKSFESFVKDWLIHQKLTNIDLVFQPQYNFVFDKENRLIVNDIYKLEEIEKLKKTLSIKLKRKITIDKKNVSNKIPQKNMYTSELKKIVYELYKNDFDLFGYEK